MLSQMISRPSLNPGFYCPTSECQIPAFTSLAACSKCESEEVRFGDNFNCTFTVSFSDDGGDEVGGVQKFEEGRRTNDPSLKQASINCPIVKKGYLPFMLVVNVDLTIQNNLMQVGQASMLGSQGTNMFETSFVNQIPPLHTTNNGLDTNSYHNCQSSHEDLKDIETINTISCFSMRPIPNRIEDLDTFSDFPVRMTRCRLYFCAQHYESTSIQNGVMSSETGSSTPLTMKANVSGDNVGIADEDASTRFHIGSNSSNALSSMVQDLIQPGPIVDNFVMPFIAKSNSSRPFVESIAEVLTALIRSSQTNPQVENFSGQAFGQITYVRVRWEWLIMPLSIVLLSMLFLVLTVAQNRNGDHRFKSSILAALFHGLEGWNADELRVEKRKGDKKERDSTLLIKADRMKVVLRKNDEGVLKFIKTD